MVDYATRRGETPRFGGPFARPNRHLQGFSIEAKTRYVFPHRAKVHTILENTFGARELRNVPMIGRKRVGNPWSSRVKGYRTGSATPRSVRARSPGSSTASAMSPRGTNLSLVYAASLILPCIHGSLGLNKGIEPDEG